MRCFLIHGILTADGGKESLTPLANAIEARGIEPVFIKYPWTTAIRADSRAQKAADRLVDKAEVDDMAVGFSNGGLAVAYALDKDCPLSKVLLVQPALRSDYQFPDYLDDTIIVHSAGDGAMPWARRWSTVTRILPWRITNPHPWGDMGLNGPDYDPPSDMTLIDQGDAAHGEPLGDPQAIEKMADTLVGPPVE